MPITIPLGGRKRIVLSDSELVLLKEILIHRVMKSKDVHDFYQAVSERPVVKNSVTNRLTRLVDNGVLLRLEETLDHTRPSVKWYYYKLAKKGLMALVKQGWIDIRQAESFHRQILSLKIPKPHNLALSSLVNQIRVKGIQKKTFDFQHSRGGAWIETNKLSLPFVPDWVFERPHRTIFLELDSGSEPLSMIESKVERYLDYCRSVKQEVILTFSIMDSSVDRQTNADRSKRIASLKEKMPPIQKWPENFSVYVLTAERTIDHLLRLFEELEPLETEYRDYLIERWIGKWEGAARNVQCNELEKERAYGSKRMPKLEADAVIKLNERLRTRTIGLIYGEEGSVKTYQQIRYNHLRTGGKMIHGERLDEIIIIYSNEDVVTNEVIGIHFWNNAWFTFSNTWEHKNATERYPYMMKPVSQYRKEWIPFE